MNQSDKLLLYSIVRGMLIEDPAANNIPFVALTVASPILTLWIALF